MNITTKNFIIQKAIEKTQGHDIQYKQRQKIFYIDGAKYTFKSGLVKLRDILKKTKGTGQC